MGTHVCKRTTNTHVGVHSGTYSVTLGIVCGLSLHHSSLLHERSMMLEQRREGSSVTCGVVLILLTALSTHTCRKAATLCRTASRWAVSMRATACVSCRPQGEE